ncbi:hypothetical protein GCM10009551_013630 [Nocardiopsis tropica]
MATAPVLHSVRDYYWGCIYCEDPKEHKGEYGHLTDDGPFFAVEDQITIEVVNSRLVEQEDADVELNVYVHAAACPRRTTLRSSSFVPDALDRRRRSLRRGRPQSRTLVDAGRPGLPRAGRAPGPERSH